MLPDPTTPLLRLAFQLVTTLSISEGQVPVGVRPSGKPAAYFAFVQTLFFPQIYPKLLQQIPYWPIVVGVVLGSIVLVLIFIGLYECGFFKRRRPPLLMAELNAGGAEQLEKEANEEKTPLTRSP